MPQTSKDWTCENCEHQFVNVISWEPLKPGDKSNDPRIACPDSQANAIMLGQPGQRIAKIKTVPKRAK